MPAAETGNAVSAAFGVAFWVWMVAAPVGLIAMLAAVDGPWVGTLSLGLTGWAAGLAVAWLGNVMAGR